MKTHLIRLDTAHNYRNCVLAYGHFSTIHPGHIRYLRHARGLGETLVVALIGDNACHHYPFNQSERAEALLLLGIADAVLLLKAEELEQAIDLLHPDVLVLGNEFKDKVDIQLALTHLQQQGGSLQFHAGEYHYATADLQWL